MPILAEAKKEQEGVHLVVLKRVGLNPRRVTAAATPMRLVTRHVTRRSRLDIEAFSNPNESIPCRTHEERMQ